MQGHERLQKFKRSYEDKQRRWNEYYAGEELFGLPRTDYPELTKMKKEIDLLEKVYSLYIDVITTVGDYKELLWSDVGEKMAEVLMTCIERGRPTRPRPATPSSHPATPSTDDGEDGRVPEFVQADAQGAPRVRSLH